MGGGGGSSFSPGGAWGGLGRPGLGSCVGWWQLTGTVLAFSPVVACGRCSRTGTCPDFRSRVFVISPKLGKNLQTQEECVFLS